MNKEIDKKISEIKKLIAEEDRTVVQVKINIRQQYTDIKLIKKDIDSNGYTQVKNIIGDII